MVAERGKIQNRERKKQIIDFSDLCFGKITPTDIDALIDFKNKLFVVMEFKHKDAPLPFGQKLALERVVDNIQNGGKECFLLLCCHFVDDTQDDIDASQAIVKEFYTSGKWEKPQKETLTAREAIDKLLEIYL